MVFLYDWEIVKFLTLNSVFPSVDVGTDLATFWDLLHHGQVFWASVTLFWVFWPWLVKLLSVFFTSLKLDWNGARPNTGPQELAHTEVSSMFYFPLVGPCRMMWRTSQLIKNREVKDDDDLEQERRALRERIFKEASSFGFYETFMESGGQVITQTVIICSTGHITNAQMISIPVSLLMLIWAASRGFFTMRDEQNQDPNPDVKMILQNVYPWMSATVLSSVIIWTCVGGMLGGFVCLPLLLNFVVCFSSLYIKDICFGLKESHNKSFRFVASLSGIWVPSVVANGGSTLLLTGITSQITKALILLILFTTATFTDTWLHLRQGRVFMLWCVEEDIVDNFLNTTDFCQQFRTNSSTWPDCLQINADILVQRSRVCSSSEDEEMIRGVMYLILGGSVAMSLLATIKLHHLSNWLTMAESSGRCIFCIKTAPSIHRAALLSKIQGNASELDEFLSKMHNKSRRQLLKKPLSSGLTAYQHCKAHDLIEKKYIIHKYQALGDKESVHYMVVMKKANCIKQLRKNELDQIINEEVDGQTPLDVALSKSLYPNLTSLLTGENVSKTGSSYTNEIHNFVEILTVLLECGAKPGILRKNQEKLMALMALEESKMKKRSVARIRHCRLGASEIGLAVTVLKNATGSSAQKAKMIVKSLCEFVEKKGVQDMVKENKPSLIKDMCEYLTKQEVKMLLNEQDEQKTALDVAMSDSSYPNISSLLAYKTNLPGNEESLKLEVKSFVTMISILLEAGARPGKSKYKMIGITNTSHTEDSEQESSKLAMAVVAWDMTEESQKHDAEMIVRTFRFKFNMTMKRAMGVPQRYLPDTILAWNSEMGRRYSLGRFLQIKIH